jgi:hypothetical protein
MATSSEFARIARSLSSRIDFPPTRRGEARSVGSQVRGFIPETRLSRSVARALAAEPGGDRNLARGSSDEVQWPVDVVDRSIHAARRARNVVHRAIREAHNACNVALQSPHDARCERNSTHGSIHESREVGNVAGSSR